MDYKIIRLTDKPEITLPFTSVMDGSFFAWYRATESRICQGCIFTKSSCFWRFFDFSFILWFCFLPVFGFFMFGRRK